MSLRADRDPAWPRSTRQQAGCLYAHCRPSIKLVFLATALLAFALFIPLWLAPGQAKAIPMTDGPVGTATQATPENTPTTQRLVISGDVLGQVEALTGQAAAAQAEIDALDAELERRTETYNELVVKLDRTNVSLIELRRELAGAQTDHDRHVKMLEERIRGVYKSGGRTGLLPMLFLADGLEDLYNRVLLISELADQDAQLLKNLDDDRARLDLLLADIDAQKQEQLSLRKQMTKEHEQIEATLAERKTLWATIDTEITAVLEAERQRQAAEQERLRQSLAGLLNGGETYGGPLPLNGDAVLDQVIETAAYYMGVPYVWAGDRPSTGFDCSGFTQYVFAQHGVSLPHYSGYQAQMGTPVDPAYIQTGDLLAFGYPVHHVGIYVSDGLFIHAPRTGDVIKMSRLSERTNLSAIRRFPLQLRMGPPAVG